LLKIRLQKFTIIVGKQKFQENSMTIPLKFGKILF